MSLPAHLSPSTESPRRPGRPKNAASRDQFLDAAVLLFGEYGLSSTTMAHIAKQMGVTSAMVHYHFASREQLLDAVVIERLLPFMSDVWGPVTPAALKNPPQAIIAMARRVLQGVRDRPWLPSLWLNDIASVSGELRERVFVHLPVDKIEALTNAITSAQKRGKMNASLQAHLIFPSIVGLVLFPLASSGYCSRLHEDADHSFEALAAHVEATLTAAMRPL